MKTPVSELSRKMGPYLRVAAAIVLAVLAAFAAGRIISWHRLDADARLLTLVNPWNPLSETGYTAKLVEAENGQKVDRACADALRQMLADCRLAGHDPVLVSAYRDMDDQLVLHDEEVQNLVNSGMTPEEAEAEVSRMIATPGRSEHELGLAVDILDGDYQVWDEKQEDTATSRWLNENCWRYGFIRRYPDDAWELTGLNGHAWHFRYVGEDAAGNINSLGITLEEYLSLFYSEEASVVYDQEQAA